MNHAVGDRLVSSFAFAAAICLTLCPPLLAQDDEKRLGWADVAELTYIATQGNAEATSLGFRNTLTHTWDRSLLTLEIGALRASTATISRVAVGDASSFEVDRDSESELTAANYFARGRFDREINERLFWFGGFGWERNTFAGIQNRLEGVGGVGSIWFDSEDRKWRTDYGFSWVHQEDVVFNPGVDENFLSARLSSNYSRQLNPVVQYTNLLILNENLNETADFRLDMTNSISVSMTDRVALKLSHQLLFDNRPSLELIPLVSPTGASAGLDVLSPLEKTDSVFNIAIVVTY